MHDPDIKKTRPTFFAKFLKKYNDNLASKDIQEIVDESNEEEEKDEERSGLMARRT